MERFSEEQLSGACSLIRDGLKLSDDDTLLLLYQRDLADAAECIREAARQLGVRVDEREFKREDFAHGYPEAFSPDRLTKIASPRGIVLLIEWSEVTTQWRLELLRVLQNQPEEWRIASMPGVDLEGLAFCNVDFEKIRGNSLIAFAVVARSELAILRTISPAGAIDELKIPIGSYRPVLSTGEIPASAWQNFPSGETYVVPNSYQAKGHVTIRGSLPLRPLKAEEWVRCEIKQGRIRYTSIEASSSELLNMFRALFFKSKYRVKCENANALAELGIGTNPSIKELTGKPIFDEKKLGTVHIAFGRNDQFHGPLSSCVHHDIVCTGCSLICSSKYQSYDLVRDGDFNLDRASAVPQLDKFPAIENLRRKVRLGRSQPQFKTENDLTMSVTYTSTGASPVFQISAAAIASFAQLLLKIVQTKEQVSMDTLLSAPELRSHNQTCRCILAGLLEYGLLMEV